MVEYEAIQIHYVDMWIQISWLGGHLIGMLPVFKEVINIWKSNGHSHKIYKLSTTNSLAFVIFMII